MTDASTGQHYIFQDTLKALADQWLLPDNSVSDSEVVAVDDESWNITEQKHKNYHCNENQCKEILHTVNM